jgi:hypothetical protein
MQTFERVETSVLVEQLMQYTAEYTLILANRGNGSDLLHLKEKLDKLQNEIQNRATQANIKGFIA